MTLLLKMSSLGVKSESMENEDEVEDVGDEGDAKEGGLSLSLLPSGRDGDDLSLSLDLTGSGRYVLERSRVQGRGEVWADENSRGSEGFEGVCRSLLAARLLRGLFALCIYTSIFSARSRRVVAASLLSSHFCTVSVIINDSGSEPVSIPVLFTVPALQLTALANGGLFLSVFSSSSISLSETWRFCLAELRSGTMGVRLSCLPHKSKDFGLSVFGRTLHGAASLVGLDIPLWSLPVTKT